MDKSDIPANRFPGIRKLVIDVINKLSVVMEYLAENADLAETRKGAREHCDIMDVIGFSGTGKGMTDGFAARYAGYWVETSAGENWVAGVLRRSAASGKKTDLQPEEGLMEWVLKGQVDMLDELASIVNEIKKVRKKRNEIAQAIRIMRIDYGLLRAVSPLLEGIAGSLDGQEHKEKLIPYYIDNLRDRSKKLLKRASSVLGETLTAAAKAENHEEFFARFGDKVMKHIQIYSILPLELDKRGINLGAQEILDGYILAVMPDDIGSVEALYDMEYSKI